MLGTRIHTQAFKLTYLTTTPT